MGGELAPDPERGGLLPRWQASDAVDPTDSPVLQASNVSPHTHVVSNLLQPIGSSLSEDFLGLFNQEW